MIGDESQIPPDSAPCCQNSPVTTPTIKYEHPVMNALKKNEKLPAVIADIETHETNTTATVPRKRTPNVRRINFDIRTTPF